MESNYSDDTENFVGDAARQDFNPELFKTKIYNRLEDNFHLSNKKALFWNITEYYKTKGEDPWKVLPVTFHIDTGVSDPEFKAFLEYHAKQEALIRKRKAEWEAEKERKRNTSKKGRNRSVETESDSDSDFDSPVPKNMYIVKPGENTN